jgi:hypothetical protein
MTISWTLAFLTKASHSEALENKEFEKLLKLITYDMVFGRGS